MPDRVDELLDEAERQPFTGWDFSWLEGRIVSLPLPWDYTAVVVAHARRSPDLLDLGTGGGEWLAELPYRPARTVATEAWPPNVAVAKARLETLGIEVVQVPPARDNTGRPVAGAAAILPLGDASFHLVVDRHESFEVGEVARILVPDGWFNMRSGLLRSRMRTSCCAPLTNQFRGHDRAWPPSPPLRSTFSSRRMTALAAPGVSSRVACDDPDPSGRRSERGRLAIAPRTARALPRRLDAHRSAHGDALCPRARQNAAAFQP